LKSIITNFKMLDLLTQIIISIGIVGILAFLLIKISSKTKENEFILNLRSEDYYEPDIIQNALDNFLFAVKWDELHLQEKVIIRVVENFPILNDPLNFGFNDLMGFAAGMNDDNKIEIYIDNQYWSQMDTSLKLAVLYHEFGHDILNLKHSSGECDIMFAQLQNCVSQDLEFKLHRLINQDLKIEEMPIDLNLDLDLNLNLNIDSNTELN